MFQINDEVYVETRRYGEITARITAIYERDYGELYVVNSSNYGTFYVGVDKLRRFTEKEKLERNKLRELIRRVFGKASSN